MLKDGEKSQGLNATGDAESSEASARLKGTVKSKSESQPVEKLQRSVHTSGRLKRGGWIG